LEESCVEIKKNDVIMYTHLHNLNVGSQKLGLVIQVDFNFWLGRQELTILSEDVIEKVSESMITFRKV
jgi:hypothetical protein